MTVHHMKDAWEGMHLQGPKVSPLMCLSVACSKDVRLPVQMQRAMAAEAEATREARAKVCSHPF